MLLISKKHGQLKQAITKMVQVVMGFLDAAPSADTKLQTIETLRTVTEGKVRVDDVRLCAINFTDMHSRSLLKWKELA